MNQYNIQEVLTQNPVIPVVTFNSLAEVDGVVDKILSQNIHCIEVTLRTTVAYDAIKQIKQNYAERIAVGMGTVINQSQIEKAKELEVDFMVLPGLNKALEQSLNESGIPFVPGVSTPTEIISAIQIGWNVLKFFPAHLFGGLEALKAYGQVFPQVKFCPTGGINQTTYKDYLALNNVLAVGGSWMVK